MNNINEIITQPEGRCLEFKGKLPDKSDIAKTAVAFANDAGGELYIGIENTSHKIVGLQENELPDIEEKISNMIYDRCYPTILPEISFLTIEGKHLIKVRIFQGSMPPYYIKSDGKFNGTYIRVGSNNRLADINIINDLERKRRNISFDKEIMMEKSINELNYEGFKNLYKEKTDEELSIHVLRKLELIKEEQGKEYPTNALVLFSDDELRKSWFPNAKIECARFKGITPDVFIDQKSITSHIGLQAEEAYNFVLRHINQDAHVEGVYTISHWEYPVKAIREVLRNAVVHRQYSLTGKDIKVAIYDDMIEVTSPGLLLPSIDFSAMESRQSDARNKIIAPVFKRMGIIDQWGNGLQLIANEMKDYPNIKLRWKEVGLSFQIQFINMNHKKDKDEKQELQQELQQELVSKTMYSEILDKVKESPLSRQNLSLALGQKRVSGQLNKVILKLISDRLIERTIPENPNHPAQKFRITKRGFIFLDMLLNKS